MPGLGRSDELELRACPPPVLECRGCERNKLQIREIALRNRDHFARRVECRDREAARCEMGGRLACAAADFKNAIAGLQIRRRHDVVEQCFGVIRARGIVQRRNCAEGRSLFAPVCHTARRKSCPHSRHTVHDAPAMHSTLIPASICMPVSVATAAYSPCRRLK